MSLLQNPIQNKLSALLGTQVTFEKLKVSLLGGVLDVRGVTVAGEDADHPVLTVARVRAEIALTKALAGEVVIKSLTIERPVVTIIRRPDGGTNLPRPPRFERDGPGEPGRTKAAGESGGYSGKAEGQDEAEGKASGNARATADGQSGQSDHRWAFDARKVLLVDGEVHYRDESGPSGAGYHAAAGPILAELKHDGREVEFTLIIDSVGRTDAADGTAGGTGSMDGATLGQVKGTGRLTNVDDLQDLARSPDAGASATLTVGDSLKVDATVESIRTRSGEVTAKGAVDLASLLPLLPPNLSGLPALAALAAANPRGRVELSARAGYDPSNGLRVPELMIRASGVAAGGVRDPQPSAGEPAVVA